MDLASAPAADAGQIDLICALQLMGAEGPEGKQNGGYLRCGRGPAPVTGRGVTPRPSTATPARCLPRRPSASGLPVRPRSADDRQTSPGRPARNRNARPGGMDRRQRRANNRRRGRCSFLSGPPGPGGLDAGDDGVSGQRLARPDGGRPSPGVAMTPPVAGCEPGRRPRGIRWHRPGSRSKP